MEEMETAVSGGGKKNRRLGRKVAAKGPGPGGIKR